FRDILPDVMPDSLFCEPFFPSFPNLVYTTKQFARSKVRNLDPLVQDILRPCPALEWCGCGLPARIPVLRAPRLFECAEVASKALRMFRAEGPLLENLAD